MFSPQSIFKPVLGLWISISEFPENFPNFNQNFKGVVTWACYFLQDLSFIHLSNYIGLLKHSVISAVTNFSIYPSQLNPEQSSIFS